MTNHESHHLITEIIQDIIDQIEQREKIEQPIKHKKNVKPLLKTVSNKQYHYVANCIRFFLMENGLIECCLQSKFPILSSGTNQFYLEYELLQNPEVTGYFCVTNVNIEHPDSRPTAEFVIKGDINVLESFIHHLLIYLCYHNISKYTIKDFSYITSKLDMNVNYLSNTVKQKIYNKFGAVFLLKNYPSNSDAHWTIKKTTIDNTYKKIVTILSGIETIISYEMSSDKNDMYNQFRTKSDSVDVNDELDQYLSQSFITRSYGKIFTLEIIESMIKERLIPDCFM
jgi:hypothetical protein